jgi:hypothetical protein
VPIVFAGLRPAGLFFFKHSFNFSTGGKVAKGRRSNAAEASRLRGSVLCCGFLGAPNVSLESKFVLN